MVINMGSGQVSSAECNKRWKKKNPEKVKESAKKADNKYYINNRKKILKRNQERRQHMKDGAVCEIIKKHHENMKNDPESLTTEFMKHMVNIKCDD